MNRLLRIFAMVTLLVLVDYTAAQGDSLPDEAYVTGVIGHAQSYTLSCEARSATDWAAFWGVTIDETEFQEALPHSDNPEQGFVGEPSDPWGNRPPQGYGVHAGPVAETLREYGLDAEAYKDLSWNELRGEISAGRPAIVWVIGQMWAGVPAEYEAQDGSTIKVAAFEHTMILVGYSTESVWVVDAYSGQLQTYWLSTFLNSWEVLGNMAVFGSGSLPDQDNPTPEAEGATYTVQEGDFLVALAERFGTTWLELANLNNIGYPYTIYPGQVLQIPRNVEQNAEPAPDEKVVNFQTHLPIVLRDNTTQNVSPGKTSAFLKVPIDKVLDQFSAALLSFGKHIGVDWHHLSELVLRIPK